MTLGSGGSEQAEGWRALVLQMIDGARAALVRLPVAVLLLAAAAANALLLVEGKGALFGGGKNDFILPLLGGALAALASCLFWEPRSRDLWVRHCGSLIAAVCAFCLIWLDDTTRTREWILLAALAGFVPVAAYIWNGTATAFWLFAVRLSLAALLALLSLLLLAGGISAILAGLTYLFGVGVPTSLYEDVWALTALFLAPLFGLGQIPRDFSTEPDPSVRGFGQRGVCALGDFVAAPLLFVYAAMLHAYALKIVLSGEVPQGQIGWMVLAYGFCLFGTLLLIHPYLPAARASSRLLARIWPFMLPVPLILLAYALWMRVSAFGLTPDRYLLGLFALVAAILVIVQSVPRLCGDIRIFVWLPAIAMLFASFGPQGALAVSVYSQTARFLDIVENKPISADANEAALSALRYVAAHDGLHRVSPPGFDDWEAEGGAEHAIALAWGLDPSRPARAGGRFFSLSYAQERAIAVSGFDLIVPSAGLMAQAAKATEVTLPDGDKLMVSLVDGGLSVTGRKGTVTFPVDPEQVRSLVARGQSESPRIRLEAGERVIMLVPTFLYGINEPQAQIRNFGGAILLRSDDWR